MSPFCFCFAPLCKGFYGGFALALEQLQEQISLVPPFSKGEAELKTRNQPPPATNLPVIMTP